MSKRIYFLKDMSEDCVDAVIITKKSTKEDIENAIVEAKQIVRIIKNPGDNDNNLPDIPIIYFLSIFIL